MSLPNQSKYDEQHLRNLEKYSAKIRRAYIKAINEVSKLGYKVSFNPNNEFYFRNNPRLSKQVDKILKNLYTEVYGTTISGVNAEWDLAVEKNNNIALFIYGEKLEKLPKEIKQKYLSNNAAAKQNFMYRKDNGLRLSEKVWNNTRQFKTELELALEHGIGEGKSAQSLARQITRYLNDPDKLFRRIRDKDAGTLRLSKAAKTYNPGRGKYRSSYKNAFRLTRNEINFSYEGSQKLKRDQQDFIVGIRIKTSPSHNPKDDRGGIRCKSLQGKYPKTFDWTHKWHVNCKCNSTNIIKTREELDKDTDKILAGKEPDTKSGNEVTKLPKEYKNLSKEWLKKSENWKNRPRTFETNKDL